MFGAKKRAIQPARHEASEASCDCGNRPLTKEDVASGGRCKCCRERHLFFHDDEYCRRCGCPRDIAFAKDPA